MLACNRPSTIDQVQAMTGTYYVLGYPVNEQWDGKFHEVKVEVKRKGCEVRAQAGYFNPKPFSEYSDLEKQLHLFDLALNERAFSRMPAYVPMIALSVGRRRDHAPRRPGQGPQRNHGKALRKAGRVHRYLFRREG